MIEYQGKYYYSCDEIANILNDENQDNKSFKDCWNDKFHRHGAYTSSAYVYKKVWEDASEGKLKHLSFKKGKSEKSYKAFNLDDLVIWLNSLSGERKTKGYRKIRDIQVIGG